MRIASLRRQDRRRPAFEALEGRALLAAAAGSLDPTFGGGYGSTTSPLGIPAIVNYNLKATQVAETPDGHILVLGTIGFFSGSGPVTYFAAALSIARENADGSPDASFGVGGQVQLPIDGNGPFRLAVQANGQILLAGTTNIGTANATYLVVRLNANGSVDRAFGSGGVAEYPAGSTTPANDRIEGIQAVFPQSNGHILLAGNSTAALSTVRLNVDGSIDTTYGQAGTATVPINASFSSAAIEANGQVVFAGDVETYNATRTALVNAEAVVARLNPDGSLDTTFGGPAASGVVLIPTDLANPSATGFNDATAVAVQPTTGDLLVSGRNDPNFFNAPIATYFATLYRLNADGTLDATFGTRGLVEPGLAAPFAPNLAVQANGDPLLTGPAASGPGDLHSLELIRLNPDGSPDATFGNTATPGLLLTRLSSGQYGGVTFGTVTIPGTNYTFSPTPAVRSSNGDILLAGVGTVPSPAGLAYGFAVDSVLSQASTGPAALTPPPTPPADFKGLGYSDLAVYEPSTGTFVYQSAINTVPQLASSAQFGPSGTGQAIPAAADYQGTGFDQFAAYLPATGTYAIQPTAVSPGLSLQFGPAGAGQAIPVPADYDGTGRADVAVYLPTLAAFAILDPGNATGRTIPFGTSGAGRSIPAPADYYGTGQADVAVYLAAQGAFAVQDPTGKTSGMVVPFGKPGVGNSIPVPGDYDGSGHVELAVYVPSQGAFYYRPHAGGNDVRVLVGLAGVGEIPATGDYDGSGRDEFAVYDPAGGFFEYQPAKGGPAVVTDLGTPHGGSLPVATPPGDLPQFTNPGSGGNGNAFRPGLAPASPTSAPAAAVAVARSSAVPAGPALASLRVARSPINQAALDPARGD